MSHMNNLPGGRKPYAPEDCLRVPVEAKAESIKASENDSTRKGQEALELEPQQAKEKLRTPCPEEYASHAVYLTFMWFLPYAHPV